MFEAAPLFFNAIVFHTLSKCAKIWAKQVQEGKKMPALKKILLEKIGNLMDKFD